MNERDIFIEALDQATAEERSEYLSVACAGDATLRQRVQALLHKHEQTGDFLQKPLVERLAEGVAALEDGAKTARDPSSTRQGTQNLGFLSPSNQPGSLGRLGHYEVQEVLGNGGMGIVLRAFDEQLHRVVAIKVMAAQLATNAAARKRFTREAQAAAAVSHDHVVTIHAVEGSGELPYLVMQFIAGMSLQERIDCDGPLALHEVLRIGMQTAAGLAAAHAQGLIHRDIKPANILLENGVERVKVTDFGLARAVADASVSQTGMVAGTPQYMSPEQARGETVDRRSDLFSLGSVLYAMCTGRPPFRGDSGISVLKRVCDDTPRPIRETNADIPEWLEAIVARLHAKDPAERYQTAAEVAELLKEHLAHLQHPSVVPLPAAIQSPSPSGRGARGEGRFRGGRRLWATAAAVLLCIAAGLGLTEATGATQLTATVIRIFTPSGTLVVETDDPAVKVTIEGDGGLVITGAGPQEVRLRPGSYKVRATKDGNSVREEELITISRGDRRVVKVSHEAASAPARPTPAKPADQPFVLMGGKGVAERKFDTLAEAVQAASDGDSIEVRGNGPFVSQPIKIARPSLVIRAGAGFRPVIKFDPQSEGRLGKLLESDAPLVLEGLEIQDDGRQQHAVAYPALVYCSGALLHVANCRLLVRNRIAVGGARNLIGGQVRNCELLSRARPSDPHYRDLALLTLDYAPASQFRIDNCVIAGQKPLSINLFLPPQDASIRMTRNAVLGDAGPQFYVHKLPGAADGDDSAVKPVQVELSSNLLDLNGERGAIVIFLNQDRVQPEEAKSLLQRVFHWRQDQDVFFVGRQMVACIRIGGTPTREPSYIWQFNRLEQWKEFWEPRDIGVLEGALRYVGGDLRAKLMAPGGLTPDDFRLRPDSAGYRAGAGGKDLGPDIDLVGPGAAYERWKQTPEYQQWLKDTGQRM
jgi:hypothetical protein